MHKPEAVQEDETQISLGYSDPNGSLNPSQKSRPNFNQQEEKKTWHLMDFDVPGGPQSENKRK